MARTDKVLKFTVFYDDEGYTEDAKKAKGVAKHLVDYLEQQLQVYRVEPWRGYYKDRDVLPGDNKLMWRINAIQRAQHVIVIITPTFLRKKWMRFWNQMATLIQENREEIDGTIIPLWFGVDEEAQRKAKEPTGPLGHSLSMEMNMDIPADYTQHTRWKECVLQMMIVGIQKPVEVIRPDPIRNEVPMNHEQAEEYHSERLRKSKVKLLRNLRIDNLFMAYFVQKGIFTDQEVDVIMMGRTSTDTNSEFLRVLSARGRQSFQVLVDTLVATSQFALALELDPNVHIPQQGNQPPQSNQPSQPPDGHDVMDTGPAPGAAEQRLETQTDSSALQNANGIRPTTIIRPVGVTRSESGHQPAAQFHGTPLNSTGYLPTIGHNSDFYHMGKDTPRRCLIICNKYFDAKDKGRNSQRRGADVDKDLLEVLFKELHYNVVVEDDLKSEEMKKLLLAESENQDHKNADAFVLIIMSHGNDNTVQGTDWNELSLKEVKDYFNAKGCPSLINKPKAFIVQACQGSHQTAGVTKEEAEKIVSDDAPDDPPLTDTDIDDETPIHEESDQLWAMATVSGHKAYRDVDKGSWFIRELVTTIRACRKNDHFLDILTKVCYQVSTRAEMRQGYKQLPETRTTLKKKWYL